MPKYAGREVGVRGIDDHEITTAPLVSAWGSTSTTSREATIVLKYWTCYGENKTTRSLAQIEHCENIIDDKFEKVGGIQHTNTRCKRKAPTFIKRPLLTFILNLMLTKNGKSFISLC